MCRRRRNHLGLTLVELLIAGTIMAMLAGSLGAIAITVNAGNDYSVGRGTALQHGRITVERIQRGVQGAFANQVFPGIIVVPETVDTYTFPDTLVIWKPIAAPANPNGLPLVSELVIYCTDPANPGRLIELTAPTEVRAAPAAQNLAGWITELANLKSAYAGQAIEITNLLRTARVNNSADPRAQRGCIRFDASERPSSAEIAAYQAGSRTWDSLPWPQNIYGNNFGLRQVMCRIEMQLRPGPEGSKDVALTVPYFASATQYQGIRRP